MPAKVGIQAIVFTGFPPSRERPIGFNQRFLRPIFCAVDSSTPVFLWVQRRENHWRDGDGFPLMSAV
jgi:hypothetical protein